MLTAHELFGFMSSGLATQILEQAFASDKDLYRLTVKGVAEAKKVRPIFLERKPKAERHADMAAVLAKPYLDVVAGNLIRGWLLKKHKDMLIDFLTALGVPHKDGTVDDLPVEMEDIKLKPAIDQLLAKYPAEEVAVYLNAFFTMNDVTWENLKTILEVDPRLQFGS
ncbi:MAG: hypothetical protein JWN25_1363 [Verrucomicrobiales bacterium]|nr:hypothetical protein [Verrucomicrobiales bacterium]